MANYRYMMSVDDIAKELNCSKSHAYKLVKSLNQEMAARDILQWQGAYQGHIGKKDVWLRIIRQLRRHIMAYREDGDVKWQLSEPSMLMTTKSY